MLREKDRKSPPSYKFTCSCNMLLYQVIDDHVFLSKLSKFWPKGPTAIETEHHLNKNEAPVTHANHGNNTSNCNKYTNITISKHPWYGKVCLSPVPEGLVIPTKYESVRIAIPFPLPNVRQLNTTHQLQSFINNISPHTKHDHFDHSIWSKDAISSTKPWFQGTV